MAIKNCDRCGESGGGDTATMINLPGYPSWCRRCRAEVHRGAPIDTEYSARIKAAAQERQDAWDAYDRVQANNPWHGTEIWKQRHVFQHLKSLHDAILRAVPYSDPGNQTGGQIGCGVVAGLLGACAYLFAVVFRGGVTDPNRLFKVLFVAGITGVIGGFAARGRDASKRRREERRAREAKDHLEVTVRGLENLAPDVLVHVRGPDRVLNSARVAEIVHALGLSIEYDDVVQEQTRRR